MSSNVAWKGWVEIVAAISIVVSLIVLISEVRLNTRAIERQSRIDQLNNVTQPYLDDVNMGVVLSKIKNVDGREPTVTAFMDAYGLTDIEAASWLRHLYSVWGALEADYFYSGPTFVEQTIKQLLPYRDATIYFDSGGGLHSDEFVEFVKETQRELNTAE